MKLRANVPIVVRAPYRMNAWADGWGRTHPAYVIEGALFDLMDTGREVPYDYGYGPGSVVSERIWIANDGTFVKSRPPMDYCASSAWLECHEDGTTRDDALFYEVPSTSKSYLLNGEPWDVRDLPVSEAPGTVGP